MKLMRAITEVGFLVLLAVVTGCGGGGGSGSGTGTGTGSGGGTGTGGGTGSSNCFFPTTVGSTFTMRTAASGVMPATDMVATLTAVNGNSITVDSVMSMGGMGSTTTTTVSNVSCQQSAMVSLNSPAGVTTFTPPLNSLPSSLTAGTSETVSSTTNVTLPLQTCTGTDSVTYNVVGTESVTVIAGTYPNAIKYTATSTTTMTCSSGSHGGSNAPVTTTMWIVPGIGTVKSLDNASGSISELVSYSVGTGGGTGGGASAPTAPSGLSVMPLSTTSLGLVWSDNSNNETGFKVERATSAAGPFTLITTTNANVVSYNDTGLNPGTAYFYRVRATNTAGDSANTAVATDTTPASVSLPVAPTTLAAAATTSSSITLSWTDNSNNETGFKIERGAALAGPFTQIGTSSANVTSYTDSGLSPATSYYYRIRSTNSAGDSAYTTVLTAATAAAATTPAAPTNLSATAAVSSINLSWTDNSNNETGFKIERSASAAGPYTQIATTAANVSVYTDAGLSVTPYYYRVRASGSAGDSAYTAVATATPLAPAATSTTVTYSPTADNLIMESTWTNTTANTAYPAGELAVGTNWTAYLDPFGTLMKTYIRAESLMKFNVPVVAGRVIDSATLTLTVQYVGDSYSVELPWHLYALASPWNASVTYNTVAAASFIYYIPNGLYLNPPTVNVNTYDITAIVQNWTNGTFVNEGLWMTPDVSLMPYMAGSTQNQAFAFYSTETAAGAGQPGWAPVLTVTYH